MHTDFEKSGIERYRLTVYGEARNDQDTAIAAIDSQQNKFSAACAAIDSFISDNEETDTSIIEGVRDIVEEALQTIEQAVTLLEDSRIAGS